MRRTILAFCFALILTAVSRADDAPLYHQDPYDTIKLDDANRNSELRVRPLDLPDRTVPEKPNPHDELEIRLLDRPRKTYKLAWEHIVEVKLFEQRVLDEADRLVDEKKLDEAYPFYDFLHRRYPKTSGLAGAYNKYLMAGAKESFKQEKFEECLALSWELYSRDPDFQGTEAAILRAADQLIGRRFAAEDYAAARSLLQVATDRLKDRATPLTATWDEKLHAKAGALIADAKQKAGTKHYAEASRAVRQSLAAWPEVEGGKELAAAIQIEYPEVAVGVAALSSAGSAPAGSWEARRVGRLLARSTVNVSRIGPYRIESANSEETRFAAVDGDIAARPKQPKQIVERLYPDVASAVRALRSGEITVVDRIGPWEAAALSDSKQFVVEPYGTSSRHLLVPNLRRPLMNDPIFRRAMAHAIDRSGILIDQLSRGKPAPGCELVDGLLGKPFASETVRAGEAAAGRRYDSGVAKLLAELSVAEVAATPKASGDNQALPSTELVLAHPAEEVARLACQAIGQQARAAGVPLLLKELSAGEMASGTIDADLIYVEWTPIEALAELPRLIGRQGLGGDAGPLVERLMRDALIAASDQAVERVGQLEAAIADETLAIPLWRLNNYVAYRRSLTGVGKRPVTLYQNVEQWQLSGARPNE